MMKRTAVATALGGIIILVGIVFLPGHEVRAMNVQVNIKDLPEYGIRIIPASDPSFDERAQSFFKGQPETMVNRLKPVLALLENTGSLAIVGNCIKWEILRRDGTTFRRPVSSVNPRALMDLEPKLVQTTMGAAIPPHSIGLISVLGSAGVAQQLDLGRSWISFRGSSSEGEEFRHALTQGNMDEAFNRSEIGKVLAEATSITVSVDFVFLEDGTFIGDENNDFFQTVNADINAQYDLATEVADAGKQGGTPEEIVNRVGAASRARSPAQGENPRIGTHGVNQISSGAAESRTRIYLKAYNRSLALYQREFMGIRDTLGAKAAISHSLRLLDKPRKELRKRVVFTK
ncbi:MAG: hypothetical protein AABO41_04050 [Acidobacteriota bacterium]